MLIVLQLHRRVITKLTFHIGLVLHRASIIMISTRGTRYVWLMFFSASASGKTWNKILSASVMMMPAWTSNNPFCHDRMNLLGYFSPVAISRLVVCFTVTFAWRRHVRTSDTIRLSYVCRTAAGKLILSCTKFFDIPSIVWTLGTDKYVL